MKSRVRGGDVCLRRKTEGSKKNQGIQEAGEASGVWRRECRVLGSQESEAGVRASGPGGLLGKGEPGCQVWTDDSNCVPLHVNEGRGWIGKGLLLMLWEREVGA